MIDPILSLAVSMHANKGVYALLLGSGVSRSSGILTGWDIVQDLVRQLAHLRKEACDPDPDGWFRETFDLEPECSEVLNQIAKSPAERAQVLRRYFEPTEEERDRHPHHHHEPHQLTARCGGRWRCACWDRRFMQLNPKTVSFGTARLLLCVLVGLLWHWWDSYSVLAALTGAPIGWALGILLAPYPEEAKKFNRWSKGLFGFLVGVAFTKVSDALASVSAADKSLLWNELLIRRVLVGSITLLVTTTVVFVARSYPDYDEEAEDEEEEGALDGDEQVDGL
jgi:hypothetical protein